MNWNDLQILLTLANEKSLSAAALVLEVSHSTVLRQLNAIEERLQTRFFERFPGAFELTEAGEVALQAAQSVEEEVVGLLTQLKGKDHRLQGKILLTAPEGITHYLLPTVLDEFCKQNQEIQIDLNVTGTSLAMARREADIAIRATSNPPEYCIGKKICEFNYAVYASPAYIEKSDGLPLDQLGYIMHVLGLNLIPRSIWKKPSKPKILMQTNSLLALVNALKGGIGAGIIPYLVGDNEPGLVRISPSIPEMKTQLWLLTHMDLRKTARIRLLMESLFEGLSLKKGLIEGEG